MTEILQSSTWVAGTASAAALLVAAGATLRWLRMKESDASAPPLAVAGYLAAMATLSMLAATFARLAVGLLAGEAGEASGWVWLIRTETVAIVGGLLLICIVDSTCNRIRPLFGAACAGLFAWAISEWVPLVHTAAEFDAVGTPLMAAILCALLVSPGPTARLVSRVRQAASQTSLHVLLVDESGGLLHANNEVRTALGMPTRSMKPFAKPTPLPAVLRELVEDPDRRMSRLRSASGLVFEAQATELTQRTPFSRAMGILVRDVTNDFLDERRLRRLAHYDSLTGLANRRLFLESLSRAMREADEQSHQVALFYIDLDGFKAINDSMGHAAGDTLLKSLAERFRTHLQPDEVSRFGLASESKLIAARLAGDEFAVIVPRVPDAVVASELANWILEFTRRPIELAGQIVKPSASIGVAICPDDGLDIETLLRHADSALYVAKSRGRQRFARYEASFDAKAERARVIEEGLRHALERDELRLLFQPKVDCNSGCLVGFEALLRWRSAELGDVGPAEFIPVAETRGLVAKLGAWCLDAACRQLREWREAGLVLVPIAVNVSAAQFVESDLQRVVSDALKEHSVEPRHLELELTETLLLGEGTHVETVLRDLRAIGVRIALDDFGTGYSALSYLTRFQLDVLKMDRGLLRDIDSNPSALGVASAVIAMAHSLDLTVVAEGVDMVEQLPILRDMSCDHIQGFLFAPALAASDILPFLHHEGEQAPSFEPGMVAPGRQSVEAPDAGAKKALTESTEKITRFKPVPKWDRGRLLLVDDGRGTLGTLPLRLVRLGIDTHYAATTTEARFFVTQEDDAIRGILVPPSIDFEDAQRVQADLTQLTGEKRRLIVVGEQPDDATRERIREAGVDWVLWAPHNDAEIRYVLKSAMALRRDLINRRDIRVPVDLVANIWSGSRREVAVASTLSTRGAFIELSTPLETGSLMRLEIELPSNRFRGFARVVSVTPDDPNCPEEPSGVGVTFYALDRQSELTLRQAISELEARYQP
jgi:diguanylate cyclase (GGDEF)-like protein